MDQYPSPFNVIFKIITYNIERGGFVIRGTTAQFKFKLPYSKDSLEWVTIKFWQPGNPSEQLPITKTKAHCSSTDSPNEICVSLSATETAMFSDKYKARVQLRAQPFADTPFGSRQQLFTVYPMLDDIITDDSAASPEIPIEHGWMILDGEAVVDQGKSIVLNGNTIV